MATDRPQGAGSGVAERGSCGNWRLGPAYAVWTGDRRGRHRHGGHGRLGESDSVMKLVSIGLIPAGVIGLNLAGVRPP